MAVGFHLIQTVMEWCMVTLLVSFRFRDWTKPERAVISAFTSVGGTEEIF